MNGNRDPKTGRFSARAVATDRLVIHGVGDMWRAEITLASMYPGMPQLRPVQICTQGYVRPNRPVLAITEGRMLGPAFDQLVEGILFIVAAAAFLVGVGFAFPPGS